MSNLTENSNKMIEEINKHFKDIYSVNDDLVKLAASLQEENNALKNRCFALTRGTIYLFCPMECEHRAEEFRTDVESADWSGENE